MQTSALKPSVTLQYGERHPRAAGQGSSAYLAPFLSTFSELHFAYQSDGHRNLVRLVDRSEYGVDRLACRTRA